jgi:hypothetical protein
MAIVMGFGMEMIGPDRFPFSGGFVQCVFQIICKNRGCEAFHEEEQF